MAHHPDRLKPAEPRSPIRFTRISDVELLDKLEAFQAAETARCGHVVSYTETVRTVLLRGFKAIESQPKRGVR